MAYEKEGKRDTTCPIPTPYKTVLVESNPDVCKSYENQRKIKDAVEVKKLPAKLFPKK